MSVHSEIKPLSEHGVNLIVQEAQADRCFLPSGHEHDIDYWVAWSAHLRVTDHWVTSVLQLADTIQEIQNDERLKLGVCQTVALFMEAEQPRLVAIVQHRKAEIERKNLFLRLLSDHIPDSLREQYEEALSDKPWCEGK